MTLAYFDLETTGLDVLKDEIFEIAAIRPDTNAVFRTFVEIRSPCIPEVVEKITGITKDILRANKAIPLEDALKEFTMWLKANRVQYLAAHNAFRFDAPFLERSFKETKVEFPRRIRFIDTLPSARELFPNIKWYNLGKIYQHLYHRQIAHEHSALGDVYAMKEIFGDYINENFLFWSFPPFSNGPVDVRWIYGIGRVRKQILYQRQIHNHLQFLENLSQIDKLFEMSQKNKDLIHQKCISFNNIWSNIIK